MYAAIGGNIAIVRTLLDHGADVSAKDKDSVNALMCVEDDIYIIQLLFDHGAGVNAKDLSQLGPDIEWNLGSNPDVQFS